MSRKRRKRPYTPRYDAWREKVPRAELMTPEAFRARKAEQRFFVLGVMGYAGSWKHSGLTGAALEAHKRAMREHLHEVLEHHRATHGDRLVVASGASNMGVLELTYTLCAERSIFAAGITSDRALQYAVGAMDFVVPWGREFGEESEHFVALCDAFVVLGGGAQSEREARAAAKRGKPVELVVGFGGAADALAEDPDFRSTRVWGA